VNTMKNPIPLHGQRTLTVDTANDKSTLRLLSPTGEIELTVEVGPSGPTVRLRATNLEIEAEGSVDIAAARVALRASEQLSLESGGDVLVRAPSGDVRVSANDDLALDGERILLNSPDRAPATSWTQFVEGTSGLKKGEPRDV
jgi:DUF4097 and DUF4098 domain-containing protein YvlB